MNVEEKNLIRELRERGRFFKWVHLKFLSCNCIHFIVRMNVPTTCLEQSNDLNKVKVA